MTFFYVGKEKFHCFSASENQIQETMRKEGFCEVDMKFIKADPISGLYDNGKLYFVSAKVESVQ